MKIFLPALVVAVFVSCSSPSPRPAADNSEGALQRRLAEFMQANDEMNLAKVLDYTYPKLFDIVPRNEMLKVMKESFDNDDLKMEMDSLRVDTLYPIFNVGKDSYAKAQYSMVMRMQHKQAGGADESEMILENLRASFGEEKVSRDESTGVIRIVVASPMVAVLDKHAKEWSFVNLKENDPMTNKLFSKEVLEKLATYK